MYWDINEILPYQRNFNFINGERSIGKTYTTLKYVINKSLFSECQFVYLVRTQDEKKQNIFELALEKVIFNEFNEYDFKFNKENLTVEKYNPDTDEIESDIIGHCLALSESVKIKKKSFPRVKYLIFDEYMLEAKHGGQYVNGWKEPDLLLSIYHTIDREDDRVICFMLGNNIAFYNPYHMHPAFNIPFIEKGKIWKSENVLFQWAVASGNLKSKKDNSKFLNMLNNTDYGRYAKDGNYIEDNLNFIEKPSGDLRYHMTIEYKGNSFGVYGNSKIGLLYISDKVDPSCGFIFALTIDDHKENTLLTKDKQNAHLKWLANNFKNGNVRFVSMEVKQKIEGGLYLIL